MDFVARAIIFLGGKYVDGGGKFHISSAGDACSGLFERLNETGAVRLELLPLYQWIGVMKKLHQGGRSMAIVPLIEYAFSMDEESFSEREFANGYQRISYDCSQTGRELMKGDLVAPILDTVLLDKTINDLLRRDQDLSEKIASVVGNLQRAAGIT